MEIINKTVNNYVKDERPEKLESYLDKNNRRELYQYYLKNSRQIERFKDAMRYTRQLSEEIMKDTTIENKREAIDVNEEIITESAFNFRDSFISKGRFNVDKEILKLSKNYRSKNSVNRKKIQQFKSKNK